MLMYIREQRSVWRKILDQRKIVTEKFVQDWIDKPLTRFVLVGSGSSNTALMFAKAILERLIQVEVSVVVPTQISTLLPLLPGQGVIFCACSQSGRSTNTLDAVKKIQAAGYPVTAISANPNAPMPTACKSCVAVLCGEETVGAKTKGMTASALTMVLMGMELALAKGLLAQNVYQETIEAFYCAADCAEANVETSINWCKEHSDLALAPHVILVADGMNCPAVLEGALKMLETLYVPVFAYEFEEYLHGVGNTLNTNSWLIFVTSDTGDRARFMALYDFAEEHGSHDYIVSTGTPTGHIGELFLRTSGNPLTLPFETLVPFHVISALLSEVKGIDCDKPQFSDFIQRLSTKIQL